MSNNKLINEYYRKLLSAILLITGGFLLLEHIFVWNGLDIEDFIGHEWYGFILVFIGILITLRYKGKYIFGGKN